MSSPNRTEIELEMRRKLLDAQRAYQSATARAKALNEKYSKSPSQPEKHPDLQQAIAAEAQALEQYRNILKEFTDLILRGKKFE